MAMVIQTNNKLTPDFDLLRTLGMEYIQQLGAQEWTDHNEHDPGVTILEQLCYAITDLCYRISYDVPDLLASPDGNSFAQLYSPATILTNKPVTLSDLKKIILDVAGVENAWIDTTEVPLTYLRYEKNLVAEEKQGEPIHIKGLYRVWINVMPEFTGSAVKYAVEQKLNSNRSLAEDFFEVKVLDEQPIKIKATIEVHEVEDPELFLATVYNVIEDHISPTIIFYSLQEMLAKGGEIEDIMSGPALEHGFIDDQELARLDRRKTIYTSDLVQALHTIPGLKAIKNIQLISSGVAKDWRLEITPDRAPMLDINFSVYDPEEDIMLQRNDFPFAVDAERTEKIFFELRKRRTRRPLARSQKDVVLKERNSRSIERYFSFQNHFPSTYGLLEGELGEDVDPKRIVLRDRLRGYLLMFDQILANCFSQAAHLREIFSFNIARTYFAQLPDSIPEFKSFVGDVKEYKNNIKSLTEDNEPRSQRKSRALNHLMARFAEDFSHFSLLLTGLRKDRNFDVEKCKVDFLKHYPEISAGRGSGIDYNKPASLSGLEKRLRIKLGYSASDDGQPCYLIEHVLLRPIDEDRQQDPALLYMDDKRDIFSLQVTYVLNEKLINHEALIYGVLRDETPVHLDMNIQWLGDEQFEHFGETYNRWRKEMSEHKNGHKLRGLRNSIIDMVTGALTYPLSDLRLVEANTIVPYDYKGKITIYNYEPGVEYELYSIVDGAEQKTGIVISEKNYVGDELTFETANLKEDSEFVVYATKKSKNLELRTRLKQTVTFRIGIDKNLVVRLEGTSSVPYNSQAKIVIDNSQEKVNYKLFDSKGNALSGAVTGVNGPIEIITQPLQEDTVAILNAAKSFEKDNEEVVEITKLEILVLPDPQVNAAMELPYIDAASRGRVIIEASQESVQYQVYYKPFNETNIWYEENLPDSFWHYTYELEKSNVRDLDVVSDESDFIEASDPVQGTGNNIGIELPVVTSDHILFVRAIKNRKDKTDALTLNKKLILLLKPRTDLELELPQSIAPQQSGQIKIKNPQRGVIYQLLDATTLAPVGEPVIYHKNKSVEQARFLVDLVISSYEEDEVILTTPPLLKESVFVLKAAQLYTGVYTTMKQPIIITVEAGESNE